YNPYKTGVTRGQMASGSIPFQYNTCDHIDLTLAQYTAGVMKEYSNSVSFYLGNYDNFINLGMRADTISIYGSSSQPTYFWADRASHAPSTVTSSWVNGVFTLNVTHNGALDLTVNCAGTATGRLTNYTSAAITPPAAPLTYTGPHQYEAECFDYKNITGYTANGYGSGISNYVGQGYLNFGTSSSADIRKTVTVLESGTYRLDTRYAVAGSTVSTVDLYVNGTKVVTPTFTQTPTLSNWAINKQYIRLNAGANTIEFRANATAPGSMYLDDIVVVPTVYDQGVIVQENSTGFAGVDGAIGNTYSGYTGAGYAVAANTNGAGINWNIYFDSSATKAFTFRYSGTNDGTANLFINGTNAASNILFPSTGMFTNWDYVTVYAYAGPGASSVRLQSANSLGLPYIDYVEITGGGAGTNLPVLAAIANQTIGVGMTLNITNTATDSDVAVKSLTYSLPTAPTNATLNANSGVLTWRPLVTQANTANLFTVKVAESGAPMKNATQSFTVTVTNLAPPQFSNVSAANGQLVLQVNGANGPDYQIQSSTNLVNWSAVFTANSPDMPFIWTNDTTGLPVNFFRIQAGPPFQQ
ncbi:MAG: carbohydrate-binding protein, partial [Limisphaerales bacterium]